MSSHLVCFPGFPQGTKTLHIPANGDGLLLDIRHRSRTFFRGQTLPVGARDAFGRRFSWFLAGHLVQFCNKQNPLIPALLPLQYVREMARTAQASDRFSALALPRFLSTLISNETF